MVNHRLRRYLPQTLTGRVFGLFACTLALFLGLAVTLFYRYEFTSGIEDALGSAQILSEVVTPTVADSVVIGDYDTVRRTLAKAIQHSPFSRASFIDLAGAAVVVTRDTHETLWTPAWLLDSISQRLSEINSIITVGGRDYGVLRLRFAPEVIAGEIWRVTRLACALVVVTLVLGLVVIRWSLRIWMEPLENIRRFSDTGGLAGGADDVAARALALRSAPLEIRETLDAFARREAEFQAQRITAAATLLAVGDGVITLDPHGIILYANPAAEALLPLPVGRLTGSQADVVLPAAFALQGAGDSLWQPWVRRRVETDGPHGDTVYLETTLGPVRDAAGTLIGHVLTLRDVSAAQAYEDRLKAELDMRLSAARSLRRALRGMLDEAEFERYATSDTDLESVARLIEGLVREREASRRALDHQKFALDQHAAVTVSDAAGRIVYANHKLSELSGYSIEELVGEHQLLLSSGQAVPALQSQLRTSILEGRVWHGEFINRHKSGSLYWVAATAVPWLDDQGRLTQYITIRTDITPQRMAERALAEAHQRELLTGREIQRGLLIGELPSGLTGVELASYNRASRGIDGDFYVVTPYRPDCFELLVGDVMGKGVPAALIGAAVRTSYNRVLTELLARSSLEAGALPTLGEIANALHRQLTPRLIELNTFVTLALYRFDQHQSHLTYVNAGHTPGLLRSAEGRIHRLMGLNVPMGVLLDETYRECTWPMRAGDTLLVYSDGITEARDAQGEEFGEDRLSQGLAESALAGVPTAAALQALRKRLQVHEGEGEKGDDETAVLVSLRGGTPQDPATDPSCTLELPWDMAHLAVLRARVEGAALAAGLSEDAVGRLVLAAFEAATNVVRHATPLIEGASLTLRIVTDPQVLAVEIWYVGEAFEPTGEPEPDFSGQSEGGFGLYIILQSVSRVSYTHPVPGVNCTRLEMDRA